MHSLIIKSGSGVFFVGLQILSKKMRVVKGFSLTVFAKSLQDLEMKNFL